MAIVVASGQSVAQPDWDALAAQHGGAKSTTKLGPSEAQIKEAALAGDDDPSFQQRPIYRYYFNDGTYVDARTAPNGADYAIVDYKPSSQYKPTEAVTPASKRTAREEAEIAANAALPKDQDPRAETNAERAARADATIKQQGQDARQAQLDAEAKAERERIAERQARADADAAAARNKPSTVATNTTEPYIVQAGPDGKITTTANPNYQGEKPERSTVKGSDGKTYIVSVGKDGKATAAPVEGLPDPMQGQTEPPGAPEIGTTPQELANGLKEYSKWLNQQVELYRTTGGKQGVEPKAAEALMTRRAALADKLASVAQNTIDTQQAGRGQDITQRGQSLQDTAGRRSAASGIYENALSNYLPMLKYAGAGGGGQLFNAFQESLNNARGYVDSFGGMRESPEIGTGQFPALAQARQASLASVQQAANPQQIFQPRPVTAPPMAEPTPAPAGPADAMAAQRQQAGANPVFRPAQPTNIQPAPPPVPPTPGAVNPVSTAPITVPQTPETGPPPPVVPPAYQFPTPTTSAPLPGPIEGLPAPGVPTAPAQIAPWPGGIPPASPEPSDMPPGFVPPMGTPQPGGPAGGNVQMAPGQQPMFLSQARFGGQGYDPRAILQKLMQDPNTSNDVLAEAYRQVYGGAPPGMVA